MSDRAVRILVSATMGQAPPSSTASVCARSGDTPALNGAATGFGVRDAFDQQDFALLVSTPRSRRRAHVRRPGSPGDPRRRSPDRF